MYGVPVCLICNTIYCVPAPTLVVLMELCVVFPEDAICVKLGTVAPLVHSKKAAIIHGYEPLPLETVMNPRVGDTGV